MSDCPMVAPTVGGWVDLMVGPKVSMQAVRLVVLKVGRWVVPWVDALVERTDG